MASNPKLPPHQLSALMDLRDRLNAAPHGERRAMVEAHAASVGKSTNTVYGWLSTYAGYDSGRKKRSDAGQTRLPGETLEAIAAMQREGIRANGKRTMPLAVAMNVADANGITVNVSESQISRLLRQRRMDKRAAPRIEVLRERLTELQAGVQTWCEAHRVELCGKGKTANLVTGEVSWRQRPPSVSISKADEVITRLRGLGLLRFIREKEEVNKEAILAEPAEVAGIKGIKVVTGVEDFVITPFEVEVGETA